VGRQRVYPSDLTEDQWEIIEPMLPLIKEPGRPPKHAFRDIVDAILYIDRSGCSWRQLPVDFPPWQTVYGWFRQWKRRGVTERILQELREQIRLAEGRDPEPSAGVIDSPSVKGADTVGLGSRGYDAGKNVNGRKRFIVTDTLGLLVGVTVLAASWQDRDGAKTLCSASIWPRRSGTCSPTRASPAGWSTGRCVRCGWLWRSCVSRPGSAGSTSIANGGSSREPWPG
jgi:transposase